MTVNEMKTKMTKILSKSNSICLFFLLDSQNGLEMKRVDIDNGKTTTELTNMFRNKLFELVENEELTVVSLSHGEERANAVYEYDYQEHPQDMIFLKDFNLQDALECENFSFSKDNLHDLAGYVIYIGDMEQGITCFKKHYSISVIKRDAFLLHKSNERFKKLDTDEIIRLNNDIHLFKLEDNVFVTNISVLESSFGFDALIRKRAEETIKDIEAIELIENIDKLEEAATDISFSRKLSKIAGQSLIINNAIPNEKVIDFSKQNPGLRDKFKYSVDGRKIVLTSKASQKYFIKLLNDDFLMSELTDQPYDSLAKDKITV